MEKTEELMSMSKLLAEEAMLEGKRVLFKKYFGDYSWRCIRDGLSYDDFARELAYRNEFPDWLSMDGAKTFFAQMISEQYEKYKDVMAARHDDDEEDE